MNHIIYYYTSRGNQIKKSDNNSWNGPCEECGGDGRFVIWRISKYDRQCPELGYYKCRECDIEGNCLTYLMKFCGFSYPDALEELGLENPMSSTNHSRGKYGKRRGRKQPPKRQHRLDQTWRPQPEQHADFVEDVEAWREHAEKFVLACHETLLQRQSALDYLAARGVGIDQVKRFRVGFNVGQSSKKKGDYQPAYKQAKAWGMPNLRRPDRSHQKTIALNAGLIVPCYQRYDDSGPSGDLLRINIRSFDRGYLISKGSLHFLQAQQIINPGHDVALVIETELDGFALSAILPDVTIIPMGSAGGVPGKAANLELRHKQLILLCLDRDKCNDKDLARWRKNNPDLPVPVYAFGAGVDKAPEKWFANYPQCQPWYCPPPHKDPGDAINAGCDMASWFAEGVSYYSVAAPKVIQPPDHGKSEVGCRTNKISDAPEPVLSSLDHGVSNGGGRSEDDNLLAFAIFWPEHAGKLLESVKDNENVLSVCRLMADNVMPVEGLLSATEGELRDKIVRILSSDESCWDWFADPAAFLRSITSPSPPSCPEWGWLIGYLERLKIDIKVVDGLVSLVFTRATRDSGEYDLEEVSAAMMMPDIDGYLSQAKNGVWRAEVFR